MNRSLHKLFDTLSNRKETTYSGDSGTCSTQWHCALNLHFQTASSDLTPVDSARFQVLDVDEKCDIRTYVQNNELIFKTGRGFYEFTKPEKISDKKEVVLVDKVKHVHDGWPVIVLNIAGNWWYVHWSRSLQGHRCWWILSHKTYLSWQMAHICSKHFI